MMNNTRANQSLSAFEEKAAPKRGALREFAAFYKPHLGMFLLDMFCALVIALVDILFPVVTRKVLYDYIPNQAMRTFLIVMGAMLAAFLIRTAAQWIVTYLGHLMGVHIEADMRTAIFAHMQKLGFSFYDKNRTGLLMSRVTTDLFDITELAHHGPEDLFISIVTLTGSFLVLWNIQKKLALVLMIAVPMIVLFVAMRRRNMMKVSRDVKRRTAGINAEIESSISGVRVAKAFGNEDEEIDKFTRCTDQYVSAKQGYYKVMAGFFSGTELMMNLMSLSVIFVGSYLIMKNQMGYRHTRHLQHVRCQRAEPDSQADPVHRAIHARHGGLPALPRHHARRPGYRRCARCGRADPRGRRHPLQRRLLLL